MANKIEFACGRIESVDFENETFTISHGHWGNPSFITCNFSEFFSEHKWLKKGYHVNYEWNGKNATGVMLHTVNHPYPPELMTPSLYKRLNLQRQKYRKNKAQNNV